MHSQSACDCYCKTRVPIARQREEIQSARSRIRDSRSSVLKTDTIRSARKIPLISAKVVDEEQFDSKRSTITLPITPDLSPETSATLEDVQKLLKDARIRMKEISMITNCNQLQKNISACPDEAPLDDENDQLLYIRERVAYKFQEANGWVDTSSTDSRIQLSGEEHPMAKPKRVVDLSAPKFRTSKDRYKEFSQQRKLDIQKLGLISSLVDDGHVSDEKEKHDDQSRSPRRERNRGINACSIQTCPPVNIKGDLITQNLQNIHISPNPFFVQESQNVGTYEIVHDFPKKMESPKKKEKVIKISENSNDDKSNGRSRKRDSRDYSDNGFTRDLDRSRKASESADDARDVNSEGEANDRATKVGSRNDQKQVRFDEQASKPESCEDRLELQNRGGTDATLEQDLKIPLTSLELKIQEVLKDNIEQFRRSSALREVETNDEHVPLSSKEIEEKHRINKRRHKEICEKRKAKDEDYKIIDKRFANIVKTYCNRNDKSSKDCNHALSSNIISSEDSAESDDLYDLYEPPLNEFDDVIVSYNKIIDNIVHTTKTIDKFLSRPELDEYRIKNTSKTKTSRKSLSVNPISLNKGKLVSIETNNSLRSDNRLPVTNEDTNLDKSKRSRSMPAPMKRSVFPSNDEPKKRYIVPKTPTKRPSIKTRDRIDARKKTQCQETTGSSEDKSKSSKMSKIIDSKRTRPLETRSFRLANDMSSLTTSSCPQSSSTDTKTTNDTRVSEEVSKSATNDENNGVATTLMINTLGVNERKAQQGNLDYQTLQDVLKQTSPETKRDSIACVKDKEVKDILNVNEIVPLMVRGLLESLKNESNFGNLKLLISERASPKNAASANDWGIKMLESEGRNLQSERPPSEGNFSTTETVECNDEIIDGNVSNRSDREDAESPNSGNQSKAENCQNENVHDANSDMSSLKEARNTENYVKSESEVDNNPQMREEKRENLISTKTVSNVAIDDPVGKGKDQVAEVLQDNVSRMINEASNVEGVDKELLITNEAENKNKLSLSKPMESVEKVENGTGQFGSSFSQVSSFDSLHNCGSLRSSSRSLSKTSNNMELSQEINEHKQIARTSSVIDDGITSAAILCFTDAFEKEKILSDVYDETHRKFLSSTCLDSDCLTLLNRRYRASNGTSTISTIESNKTEISSSTSHSEGELSSGSYSLGEIRMLTKSRSDGENADEFDDGVPIFVTKKMLTSWNESSKSLIQSIGEI